MDGSLHHISAPRSGRVLFDEDFDMREPAPEPEVIEPVFSAAELATVREAAWRDGHAKGIEEAAATDATAARQALEAIARGMGDARAAVAEQVEAAADAIARLLLGSLAAAFPALCASYGDAEAKALVAAVLPGLSQEPSILVRANRHTIPALTREIAGLELDVAAHIEITPSAAMAPGDVRITWRNGSAARDASALWQQVAEILAPAGLLRPQAAIRETADVE